MKFFILSLLLCCLQSAANEQDDKQCNLVVRFENYSAQAQQNDLFEWHGLDVDFAKALLDEAGCTYRFVAIPWGRSLKMLEQGDIDLMLSVSKTSQRMLYAYFIGPQRSENIVFAMNADHTYHVSSLDELFALDLPVAIQRGAYYGQSFENYFIKEKNTDEHFIYVPDNQMKLNLLRHGRISGFLEEKANVIYQAKHNPDFVKITISPFIIHTESVYFAFSKQSISKSQIKRFNVAFDNLQSSGKLSEILAKYNLE